MPEIILTTLNARYIHSALGLRSLRANLGALYDRSALMEFDLHTPADRIIEALHDGHPKIIGLGVYIWNAGQSLEVVRRLKRDMPDSVIIIGGPEVSYEQDRQEICRRADYVICGEAEELLPRLCTQILAGNRPDTRILEATPPDTAALKLPCAEYSEEDIAHRIIYVESTRGCPYACDYCMSALDSRIRPFPMDKVLHALTVLHKRGVRHFKFTDRTMNADIPRMQQLLDFFLPLADPSLTVHFELVPDRLPVSIRERITCFPAHTLHFEIGIQTWDPETAKRIHRPTDYERVMDNLAFILNRTGAWVHADLIAGLPGETLESFGAGFDRLLAFSPHEIQVGILKRLRGAPITRHDDEWQMVYRPTPPFDLLAGRSISAPDMQRIHRFARYWEIMGNRGNFRQSLPLLWANGVSPFDAFMAWSDWLYAQVQRTHSIPLLELVQSFQQYLVHCQQLDPARVNRCLRHDYRRDGQRHDVPHFLRTARNQ